MEFGELKPLLKALLLPPAGLLLLAMVGAAVGWRRRRAGAFVVVASVAALWLLSCNAVAVLLSRQLLEPPAPITTAQLQSVQAIVVLGGGTLPQSPEYGAAQPAASTLQRIRFAAALARRSGKPVAFASGTGWGGTGPSEAEVAGRVLQDDYGIMLRWREDRSRDTRENANNAAAILLKEGVRWIALVTDATHMPRAERNFRDAGFDVIPAPTAFIAPRDRALLEWLPSTHGLRASRYVLHEWLGLRLT